MRFDVRSSARARVRPPARSRRGIIRGAAVFYTFSGTCGRTNESLTFPVNCGFMVYRRTARNVLLPGDAR